MVSFWLLLPLFRACLEVRRRGDRQRARNGRGCVDSASHTLPTGLTRARAFSRFINLEFDCPIKLDYFNSRSNPTRNPAF